MSNVAYNSLEDSLDDSNGNSSCLGLLGILFLGICCAVGTSVGIYLMMTEDIYRVGSVFTLVPNNRWTLDHTEHLLKLPAKRIFIADTNTGKCSVQNSDSSCLQFFKNFTKEDYNFLVDKDGVILEELGWHYPCQQSPSCDDSSISIAFMGAFADDNCPKPGAVQAVINFIESSQANSKIIKCFMTTVDVDNNNNNSTNLCLLQVASNIQDVTKKYGC